jgi:hypothetical protein
MGPFRRRACAAILMVTACGRVSFDGRDGPPAGVCSGFADAELQGTRSKDGGLVLDGDRLWRFHPDWLDETGLSQRWSFEGSLGAIPDGACIAEEESAGCGRARNTADSSMAYVPGRVGHGVSLDGVDDRIDGLEIALGAERSAGGWIWFRDPHSDTISEQLVMLRDDEVTPGSGMYLSRYGIDGTFLTSGDTGGDWPRSYVRGVRLGVPGRWHHAVAVHTATSVRVYVNGQFDGERILTSTEQLAPLQSLTTLGGEQYGGWLNGVIDEVSVWDRALSEAEIRDIYLHQSPPFVGELRSPVCDAGGPVDAAELRADTMDLGPVRVDRAGLVALWPLNGPFGSVADGTPAPAAGDGPAGEYRNVNGDGLVFEEGPVAEAARFDGVDDFVQVPAPAPTPAGDELSVVGWVRIDGPSNGHPVLAWDTLWLGITNTDRARFQIGGELLERDSPTTDRAWHHLAGVYAEGRFMRLYLDGEVAFAAMPVAVEWDPGQPLRLASDGGLFLAGQLDEVSLWARALTPDEVRALYLAGAARVRLQTRACEEPTCASIPFSGPDGSASSFYQAASYPFDEEALDFSLSLAGRYVQWRAVLESELTTAGPTLTSVELVLPAQP